MDVDQGSDASAGQGAAQRPIFDRQTSSVSMRSPSPSITPPPPLPRFPSAVAGPPPSPSLPPLDYAPVEDMRTVADVDGRARVGYGVWLVTRRASSGSNLDPPRGFLQLEDGAQVWLNSLDENDAVARARYTLESARIDTLLATAFFPEDILFSAPTEPLPRPEHIAANLHRGAHGPLPVLGRVSPWIQDRILNAPRIPTIRDIPLSMMLFDMDAITFEAFDIGGRIVDSFQPILYHLVRREDDEAFAAAQHLLASVEGLLQLLWLRRIVASMGRRF